MSETHDSNGRFKKGNSASSMRANKRVIITKMKNEMRDVFFQCIHDFFTMPVHSFKDKVTRKDATAFEHMLGQAVAGKKYQFITYVIDHAIGKPNNAPIDKDGGAIPVSTIIRQDGTKVEFTLGVREVNEEEKENEDE